MDTLYDSAWVLEQIEQIAQFSQDKPNITRLAFTPADHQARNYMSKLMEKCGLNVEIDAIGNIIGQFQPADVESHVPVVATGSHLDTVPSGGKYDGVLGVLCGLAAVSRIRHRGEVKHPLKVIAFAAEESSRFNLANMGSKAMAGLAHIPTWKRLKDHNGVSLADELEAMGLPIERLATASCSQNSIKGFVELHIEQGQVLAQRKMNVGIVDTISAPTRLKIIVTGTAGHSGVTDIADRQDALVSAAMIVLSVRDIAAEYEYQGAVATVTTLHTYPGTANVIADRVELWVDIFGTVHENIVDILQEIKDAISSITEDYGTPAAIDVVTSEKAIKLDAAINRIIEKNCRQLNLSSIHIDSRTAHSVMNIARIAPSALLFIPCKDSISHNEYTAPYDIAAGLDVLTETLYQLAK